MKVNMNQTGTSQKAIIINKEGEILTLFRTETAPTRPSTWDLPGGDLDFGEDAQEGMVREIKEETGLKVRELRPFDIEAKINPDGDYWITIAYLAYALDGEVTLSSEHNKFMWVSISKFLEINTSSRAERFIRNLLEITPKPHIKE